MSDIAALPRIVTLHDIEISPKGKDSTFDELVLNVTAKTYRYLDEEELSAISAAEDPSGKTRTTRDTSKGKPRAPAGKKKG